MLVQARTLADQASAIMAEGNWNDLQELGERYAGLSGERVTFILPDGRVAADLMKIQLAWIIMPTVQKFRMRYLDRKPLPSGSAIHFL